MNKKKLGNQLKKKNILKNVKKIDLGLTKKVREQEQFLAQCDDCSKKYGNKKSHMPYVMILHP